MEHYDIMVFENYWQALNHKIDMMLIAHLLKQTGLSVAILDIYHEDYGDEKEGIPIVHHHVEIPKTLTSPKPTNILRRIAFRLRYFQEQYAYMAAVRDEVKDYADTFYCGSYYVGMSSAWFELQKPCYWWGLRSNRFVLSIDHFKSDKMTFFRIPYLRRKFMRNDYQRLFVSNKIIYNEFKALGVPDKRMTIREERIIEELGNTYYDSLSQTFTFLTIGQLRPEKRIEYSIKAFLDSGCDDAIFNIVGRSKKGYEDIVRAAAANSPRIQRIDEFLEYSKFIEYFKHSHFVIFADKAIKGTVTNGTMLEALINYRPIIAPDYDPYRYYIKKYNIGILYNPQKNGDLERAMREATKRGCRDFERPISEYLKTITFDLIAHKLRKEMWKK